MKREPNMPTKAEGAAEREGFEERERMRQHARDNVTIKARRDVIRKHKPELETGDEIPGWFERLLQRCEKDAREIACEAGEEAGDQARQTEPSVAAYEAAYIEAYADALPALVATTLAEYEAMDPAA